MFLFFYVEDNGILVEYNFDFITAQSSLITAQMAVAVNMLTRFYE